MVTKIIPYSTHKIITNKPLKELELDLQSVIRKHVHLNDKVKDIEVTIKIKE